ncbi:MAG TPA: branched-chain amino acid ABC transporter permease [Candidatus Deferrimicrobiaceae bacterium]|nr:branched-chain amino acid ABC transporter permease [Candidatus Deferrimicrobiaceae bacterium]
MDYFLQQVVNGLQIGFVYALIALGYTMVYGIVRLINFAHGDVFMVGAFIGLYAIERAQLPLPVVLLLAVLGCALLAVAMERVAYRPLRGAPKIASLITAIGVSLFLEYFTALHRVFGPNFYSFPRPFAVSTWEAAGLSLTNIQAIIFLVTLACLALLQFIVYRTRLGRAMRAVSHDHVTAGLMGVNVDLVISFTFGLGAALAGVGGVLYGIAYPQVNTFMGVMPGLKAFTAAVLGGIGSIPGAVLGALIMGQSETLTSAYLSSTYRDGIAFLLLILVLLLRPTGILGISRAEKV